MAGADDETSKNYAKCRRLSSFAQQKVDHHSSTVSASTKVTAALAARPSQPRRRHRNHANAIDLDRPASPGGTPEMRTTLIRLSFRSFFIGALLADGCVQLSVSKRRGENDWLLSTNRPSIPCRSATCPIESRCWPSRRECVVYICFWRPIRLG